MFERSLNAMVIIRTEVYLKKVAQIKCISNTTKTLLWDILT